MSPLSLLLWTPLFVVVCCSLEESLELSTFKRSHVLCYTLRLLLELLVSLLRFPIRCLAYLHLCKPSHVYEFVELTRDITQFLDLWTEEEFVLEAAYMATRAELIQERKRNIHDTRLQTYLTSAQADIVRLRRENATLALGLRETCAERTGLHENFDRNREAFDSLNKSVVEERSKLLARLAEEQESASHTQADLETANARIRELVAKLKSTQDALAQSKATCKRLATEKQQLSTTIANLHSDAKRLKIESRQYCRDMNLKYQKLGKHHTSTTRRLVFLVVLLHGSCHSLGARFRSALHVKDLALSRWRAMSAQKVETNRLLIRCLGQNEDLKDKLQQFAQLAHCDNDLEKEALAYRSMYHNSVRTRRTTADIFLAFQQHTELRFLSTTSNLLGGILVLWKLNLILTKRLAGANCSVLALSGELETARALLNRQTFDIGIQCNPVEPATPPRVFTDVAVQWTSTTPPRVLSSVSIQCSPSTPPRVLSNASVQCSPDILPRQLSNACVQCSPDTPPRQLSSASIQCSPMTPPRLLVDVSTQTVEKMKPPRSVLSPPPVFAFGNLTTRSENSLETEFSAPLLLPSPLGEPIPSTSTPSSSSKVKADALQDRDDLDERLQRLLAKFDALNSVHYAYRDLLLAKARPTLSPLSPRSSALSREGSRESVFDRRRSLATSIHAS
ncbi:hypothetical protein PHLGIDRAFT_175784 [Phlebiopsis gigantea 11061_1 CR5-6]|uniref:Pericentrin/AKAP-450 centrosomal targeting domain-containing protein n=1 Tax=Phlebiopsis gigantea (strain 11061_1 CR5-6) TaxID=745531 RepID=A0A0C3NJ80_PHLG1|nr:hypothetical protein PHLGIDRAFT_175784 [Phlebiopsis gigantea 11061_1 CR5-6]